MRTFSASIRIVSATCIIFFAGLCATGFAASTKQLQVLASIFPVYQITRNVTAGRDAIRVESMLPPDLGCPHDYALTPQDMRKLSQADVLVVNGLGLEEFLGEPVARANTQLKVIDGSSGLQNLLLYASAQKRAGHEHEGQADAHEKSGANPHIFASPRMSGLMARTIAAGLAEIDPAGAQLYLNNASSYAARMEQLAGDMRLLGKRLANTRIVTQHAVFDYLARDIGLEVVAVVESHGGQEPSAAEMIEIVQTIKSSKAGALFTEPQYREKSGRTIAAEAGIPSARLDPAANGPPDAPLDHFSIVMRRNMAILEKSLGTK